MVFNTKFFNRFCEKGNSISLEINLEADQEEEKVNPFNSSLKPRVLKSHYHTNFSRDFSEKNYLIDLGDSLAPTRPECCLFRFYQNISAWFERLKCPICLDPMLVGFKAKLKNCKHSFHLGCLRKYLETMIKEKHFPIRCAMDGCSCEILESDILENLDGEYKEKFYSFTLKHFVETHMDMVFCCPTPNCEYFAFQDVCAKTIFSM